MKRLCACGDACKCKNCLCSPYAIFFSTLGNETRLYVLEALREGPVSVMEIVRQTGLEQTLVSHSLNQLERFGFVSGKKSGKFMIYRLNSATIRPLMSLIDSHVRTYCTGFKRCGCTGGKK